MFQVKIDRTLEYSTLVCLDDITVVTRGDRKEHEKKLVDVIKKLETAGYRASERKYEFFFKKKQDCSDTKPMRRESIRTTKKKQFWI